jgi:hypothetical protein
MDKIMDKPDRNGAGRYKRDVRDATKYIETAIIIDKAMFDKRNGSTRAEIVHDAIQVANIADLVSFHFFKIKIIHLRPLILIILFFLLFLNLKIKLVLSNVEYTCVGCLH